MTFLNHTVSLVNDDVTHLCYLAQVFITLHNTHILCLMAIAQVHLNHRITT